MSKHDEARARFQKIANPTGSRKATSMANLTVAVAFSTLTMVFTKVIGFLREILILQKLGFGFLSDGYYFGFAIPDLFYELLIGGAISAAITPTLAGAIEHNDEERAWKPISIFFSVSVVVMVLVTLLGGFFIEPMLKALYPTQPINTLAVATSVGRIIFFQTFFFILIGEMTAVLSANKEFVAPNIGNTIYNIGCLLAILFFANQSQRGVEFTAVGIVISAAAYFVFLLYFAKPNLKFLKFNLDVRDEGFKTLLRIALPAVVAGTFNQLNFIVQQRFSDQFSGAVTSLNQAKQLTNLPFGIISAGIGSVVVANLSGFYARKALREARAFLSSALRMALYLIAPCAVIFLIIPFETVQAVFQWDTGKYNDPSVVLTGQLLSVFAIALIVMMLNYFYTQAFYAMKKSFIALVTGALTLLVNPLMCFLFIRVFDFGLMGIGLASLTYNVVNFIVINLLLRHYEPGFIPQKMWGFGLQLLGSSAFAALILMAVKFFLPSPTQKILQLLLYAGEAGIVLLAFFAASYALRVTESRALVAKLSGRAKEGAAWADVIEETKKEERHEQDQS